MSEVLLEQIDGVPVFRVPERVDVSNTKALVSPVHAQIQSGQHRIVLDFSGTQAIDSTALGALVQVFKLVRGQGGALILAGVGDAVRRVFSITRLDTVFTVYPTVKEAVSSLQLAR